MIEPLVYVLGLRSVGKKANGVQQEAGGEKLSSDTPVSPGVKEQTDRVEAGEQTKSKSTVAKLLPGKVS